MSKTRIAAADLPELCYVFIAGAEPGKRIGIIKCGESGYHLTEFDAPDVPNDYAQEAVQHFNKRLGVTSAQVLAMEIGSMFGWDVPGANPANHPQTWKA
jgi:hypothetical protein